MQMLNDYKVEQSKEISAQVEAYLEAGGTVTVFPSIRSRLETKYNYQVAHELSEEEMHYPGQFFTVKG